MVNKTQLEGMVEGLTAVKEEFFRLKDEEKVSVRKDVVATELKQILNDSSDYETIKSKITDYIAKLYEVSSRQ